MFFSFVGISIVNTFKVNKVSYNSDKNSAKVETKNEENKNEKVTAKHIGDEGSIGELRLTVNKSKLVSKISAASGYMSYEPDSGKYAIINVTIKNNNKESKSLMLSDFTLIHKDGSTYPATLILTADENFLSIDSVNPKLSVNGNLAFEVPKDIPLSEYNLVYKGDDSQKFLIVKK